MAESLPTYEKLTTDELLGKFMEMIKGNNKTVSQTIRFLVQVRGNKEVQNLFRKINEEIGVSEDRLQAMVSLINSLGTTSKGAAAKSDKNMLPLPYLSNKQSVVQAIKENLTDLQKVDNEKQKGDLTKELGKHLAVYSAINGKIDFTSLQQSLGGLKIPDLKEFPDLETDMKMFKSYIKMLANVIKTIGPEQTETVLNELSSVLSGSSGESSWISGMVKHLERGIKQKDFTDVLSINFGKKYEDSLFSSKTIQQGFTDAIKQSIEERIKALAFSDTDLDVDKIYSEALSNVDIRSNWKELSGTPGKLNRIITDLERQQEDILRSIFQNEKAHGTDPSKFEAQAREYIRNQRMIVKARQQIDEFNQYQLDLQTQKEQEKALKIAERQAKYEQQQAEKQARAEQKEAERQEKAARIEAERQAKIEERRRQEEIMREASERFYANATPSEKFETAKPFTANDLLEAVRQIAEAEAAEEEAHRRNQEAMEAETAARREAEEAARKQEEAQRNFVAITPDDVQLIVRDAGYWKTQYQDWKIQERYGVDDNIVNSQSAKIGEYVAELERYKSILSDAKEQMSSLAQQIADEYNRVYGVLDNSTSFSELAKSYSGQDDIQRYFEYKISMLQDNINKYHEAVENFERITSSSQMTDILVSHEGYYNETGTHTDEQLLNMMGLNFDFSTPIEKLETFKQQQEIIENEMQSIERTAMETFNNAYGRISDDPFFTQLSERYAQLANSTQLLELMIPGIQRAADEYAQLQQNVGASSSSGNVLPISSEQIQVLVDGINKLATAFDTLNQAMGSVDEANGVKSLLQQLQQTSTGLDNLNTNMIDVGKISSIVTTIESLTTAFGELNKAIGTIDETKGIKTLLEQLQQNSGGQPIKIDTEWITEFNRKIDTLVDSIEKVVTAFEKINTSLSTQKEQQDIAGLITQIENLAKVLSTVFGTLDETNGAKNLLQLIQDISGLLDQGLAEKLTQLQTNLSQLNNGNLSSLSTISTKNSVKEINNLSQAATGLAQSIKPLTEKRGSIELEKLVNSLGELLINKSNEKQYGKVNIADYLIAQYTMASASFSKQSGVERLDFLKPLYNSMIGAAKQAGVEIEEFENKYATIMARLQASFDAPQKSAAKSANTIVVEYTGVIDVLNQIIDRLETIGNLFSSSMGLGTLFSKSEDNQTITNALDFSKLNQLSGLQGTLDASGEITTLSGLRDVINDIVGSLRSKNRLLENEVQYASNNIPNEIQLMQDLAIEFEHVGKSLEVIETALAKDIDFTKFDQLSNLQGSLNVSAESGALSGLLSVLEDIVGLLRSKNRLLENEVQYVSNNIPTETTIISELAIQLEKAATNLGIIESALTNISFDKFNVVDNISSLAEQLESVSGHLKNINTNFNNIDWNKWKGISLPSTGNNNVNGQPISGQPTNGQPGSPSNPVNVPLPVSVNPSTSDNPNPTTNNPVNVPLPVNVNLTPASNSNSATSPILNPLFDTLISQRGPWETIGSSYVARLKTHQIEYGRWIDNGEGQPRLKRGDAQTIYDSLFKDLETAQKEVKSIERDIDIAKNKFANINVKPLTDSLTLARQQLASLEKEAKDYIRDPDYGLTQKEFDTRYGAIKQEVALKAQMKTNIDEAKALQLFERNKNQLEQQLASVNSFYKQTPEYANVVNLKDNAKTLGDIETAQKAFRDLQADIAKANDNLKAFKSSLDPTTNALSMLQNTTKTNAMFDDYVLKFQKLGKSLQEAEAAVKPLRDTFADWQLIAQDINQPGGMEAFGEYGKAFNLQKSILDQNLKLARSQKQVDDQTKKTDKTTEVDKYKEILVAVRNVTKATQELNNLHNERTNKPIFGKDYKQDIENARKALLNYNKVLADLLEKGFGKGTQLSESFFDNNKFLTPQQKSAYSNAYRNMQSANTDAKDISKANLLKTYEQYRQARNQQAEMLSQTIPGQDIEALKQQNQLVEELRIKYTNAREAAKEFYSAKDINQWIKDFNKDKVLLFPSVKDQGNAIINSYKQSLNEIQQQLKDSFSNINTGTFFTDITQQLDELQNKLETGAIVSWTGFINELGNINDSAINIGDLTSALDPLSQKFIQMEQELEGHTQAYKDKFAELRDAMQNMFNARGDQDQFNIYKQKVADLFIELEKISDQTKLLNKDGKFIDDAQIQNVDQMISKMQEYAKTNHLGSETTRQVNADTGQVALTFADAAGQTTKLTGTLEQLSHGWRLNSQEMQAARSSMSILSSGFMGFAKSVGTLTGLTMLTMRFRSELTKGLSTFKEYDATLTNISYTMNLTSKELQSMGQSAINMAKDLSMSISNAEAVYKIYANMNTTAEEIQRMAKPTVILSNLSGVDASTAADEVQGILQQFNMLKDTEQDVADVSMHVVDVLDNISANIAMDYSKGIEVITQAVTATGQVAHDAGMSFEQLAAISAKVAERTREDGSSIGNAMKTIITRISKVNKMPQYADEVSNEELSKASESLHSIGVEVYKSNGEMNDMITILTGLRDKWDSLTDAQQANIAFNIAATRQTSKFKNILEAWTSSMELADQATEANGNAMANQEKYQESMTGKLTELRTQMDAFWISLYNSDTTKKIIDFLTTLVKGLNELGSHIGQIQTLVLMITGLTIFRHRSGFTKGLAALFANMHRPIGLVTQATTEATATTEAATAATAKATTATAAFGTTLGQVYLVLGLAALAIGAVVVAYNKYGQTTDLIIKRNNKLIESQQKTTKELENTAKENNQYADSLESLLERYEQAEIGSTEYYNIRSQIADQFPELVVGYDAEGRAIIANTEAIRNQIQAYRERSAAARDSIQKEANNNINNIVNGSGTNGGDGLKQLIEQRKKLQSNIENGVYIEGYDSKDRVNSSSWRESLNSYQSQIKDIDEQLITTRAYLKNQYALLVGDISDLTKDQTDALNALETVMSYLGDTGDDFIQKWRKVQAMSPEQQKELTESINNLFNPDLSKIGVGSEDYLIMMEGYLKEFGTLLNLDRQSDGFKELEYQLKSTDIQETINNQVNDIVNNLEYQDMAQKLGINLEEAIRQLKVSDIQLFNADNFFSEKAKQQIEQQYGDELNKLKELTNVGLMDIDWGKALTGSEGLAKNIAQDLISKGVADDIQSAIDLMERWKWITDATAKAVIDDFDVFRSETSESLKSAGTSLTALNSAFSEMNKNGYVTKDTYAELTEANNAYSEALVMTSRGLTLDRKKVKQLRKDEIQLIKTKINEKYEKLQNTYQTNKEEIAKLENEIRRMEGAERADLAEKEAKIQAYNQANQAIQGNISSLQQLRGELASTTGYYAEWQATISNGSHGDQYNTIQSWFEQYEDLAKKHFFGNTAFQAFTSMFTGIEDFTGPEAGNFVEMISSFGEKYFTEDASGAVAMYKEIRKAVEEAAKNDPSLNSWLIGDEDVMIGNMEQLALIMTGHFREKMGEGWEQFVMTSDLMEIFGQMFEELGLGDGEEPHTEKDMEDTIAWLEKQREEVKDDIVLYDLYTKAIENAKKSLFEFQVTAEKFTDKDQLDSYVTDIVDTLNQETSKEHELTIPLVFVSKEDAESTLQQLFEMREELEASGKGGEINEDTGLTRLEEINALISFVLGQKQEFEKPWILSIDTSQVADEKFGAFLSKLQEYHKAHDELEQALAGGNQETIDAAKEKVAGLNAEIQKLDKESNGEFSLKVGLDLGEENTTSLDEQIKNILPFDIEEKDNKWTINLGIDGEIENENVLTELEDRVENLQTKASSIRIVIPSDRLTNKTLGGYLASLLSMQENSDVSLTVTADDGEWSVVGNKQDEIDKLKGEETEDGKLQNVVYIAVNADGTTEPINTTQSAIDALTTGKKLVKFTPSTGTTLTASLMSKIGEVAKELSNNIIGIQTDNGSLEGTQTVAEQTKTAVENVGDTKPDAPNMSEVNDALDEVKDNATLAQRMLNNLFSSGSPDIELEDVNDQIEDYEGRKNRLTNNGKIDPAQLDKTDQENLKEYNRKLEELYTRRTQLEQELNGLNQEYEEKTNIPKDADISPSSEEIEGQIDATESYTEQVKEENNAITEQAEAFDAATESLEDYEKRLREMSDEDFAKEIVPNYLLDPERYNIYQEVRLDRESSIEQLEEEAEAYDTATEAIKSYEETLEEEAEEYYTGERQIPKADSTSTVLPSHYVHYPFPKTSAATEAYKNDVETIVNNLYREVGNDKEKIFKLGDLITLYHENEQEYEQGVKEYEEYQATLADLNSEIQNLISSNNNENSASSETESPSAVIQENAKQEKENAEEATKTINETNAVLDEEIAAQEEQKKKQQQLFGSEEDFNAAGFGPPTMDEPQVGSFSYTENIQESGEPVTVNVPVNVEPEIQNDVSNDISETIEEETEPSEIEQTVVVNTEVQTTSGSNEITVNSSDTNIPEIDTSAIQHTIARYEEENVQLEAQIERLETASIHLASSGSEKDKKKLEKVDTRLTQKREQLEENISKIKELKQELDEANAQLSEGDNVSEISGTFDEATASAEGLTKAVQTASEQDTGDLGTPGSIAGMVALTDATNTVGETVQTVSTNDITDLGATYAKTQVDNLNQSLRNTATEITNIPSEKTVTITTNVVSNGSVEGTAGLSSGTAKFSFGRALAQGDMGAAKTETALVGELGPEMRVRGSKWELLGESGPEFRDVRKGDIIFNHQQTADLLSSGRTGARGRAFGYGTNGSAYGDGKRTYNLSAFTSTASAVDKYLGGGGSDDNDDTIKSTAEHLKDNSDDTKEETKSALEDLKKKWGNAVDFVEVTLEHLESLFNKFVNQAEFTNYTRATRDSAYNKALSQMDTRIDSQKKSKSVYEKRASSVWSEGAKELSSDVLAEAKKAKEIYEKGGSLEIFEFNDEDAKTLVEEWQKWYDKAEKSEENLLEMEQERLDLIKSQAELVVNEAQNKKDRLSSRNDRIQSRLDHEIKLGSKAAMKKYERMNENNANAQVYTQDQIEALEKAQKSTKKGTEAWWEYEQQIEDLKTEQVELNQTMRETAANANLAKKELADNKIDVLNSEYSRLESSIQRVEKAGGTASKTQYKKLNDNLKKRIELTKTGIEALKNAQAQYDEGTVDWWNYQKQINEAQSSIDSMTDAILDNSSAVTQLAKKLAELKISKLDNLDEILDAKIEATNVKKVTKRNNYVQQKTANIAPRVEAYKTVYQSDKQRVQSRKKLIETAAKNEKISNDHKNLIKQIVNAADGTNQIDWKLLDDLEIEIAKDLADKDALTAVYDRAIDYQTSILARDESKQAYQLAAINAKVQAEANANQMKENAEAQRNQEKEKAQKKNSLADAMFQNTQGRNVKYTASLGRAEARSLKAQYQADVNYTKQMEKDLATTGNTLQSSMLKEQESKLYEKNKKYRQALDNALANVKAKKKIKQEDIETIGAKNKALGVVLVQWNMQIDNTENARLEQQLSYATMSSRLAEITNENFARQTQVSENRMAQNDADMEIATSAAEKNKLLEANNSELDRQDAINAAKTAEWLKKRNEAKSDVTLMGNELLEDVNMPKKYKNAIIEALRCCEAGETIGESTMEDLMEGVEKGYITEEFFQACYDYCQANEQYRQAKYTQELEAARNKKQRAQNALKMVQNVVTEGQNLRNWRSTWGAKGDKMGYDRNNKNKTAFNRDYAEAFGHYTHEEDIEDDIHNTYLDLYQYQIDYEEAVRTFNEQVAKGALQPGMDEWFEAQQVIEDARKGIDDTTLALKELRNELRQLKWLQFDDLMASMQRVNDEIAHFITMLSNEMMFDEFNRGDMTQYGLATATLHNEARQINLGEALRYQQELDELNAQVASGVLDWTDKNVIARQRQLTDSIREHVEAVESEKQALIDLVRQGYEAQLSALNKTISKYKELKDQEKEAYDYQKRIAEQTKNINNIQKQLAAFESNTSEEAVATIQRLQKELKTAKQERSDFQYERYLSDVQAMLDDLSSNFQEWIEYYMRDRDQVLRDMINEINGVSQDLGLDINTAAGNAQIALDTIRDSEIKLFEDQNDYLSTLSDELKTAVRDTGSTSDTLLNTISEEHADLIKAQSEIEQNTYLKDQEIASNMGSEAKNITDSIDSAAGKIEKAIEGIQVNEVIIEYNESEWENLEDTETDGGEVALEEHSYLNGIDSNKDQELIELSEKALTGELSSEDLEAKKQAEEEAKKRLEAEKKAEEARKAAEAAEKAANNKKPKEETKKGDTLDVIESDTTPVTTTPSSTQGNGKVDVGDKVTYDNGKYYEYSDGTGKTNNKKLKKSVYIVEKEKGAAYPYLISTSKDPTKIDKYLGWVKKSQITGYAMGTKFAPNGPAWTQERGSEVIYRKSDGAMLTPLGQGDMVFSHAMSENLWNLAKMNIPDMIEKALTQPVVTNKQEVAISPQTNIHMNVTLPNVRNYEEFRQAMLNDKQFQNGIQEMTLGAAMGRNSLSKYKYM